MSWRAIHASGATGQRVGLAAMVVVDVCCVVVVVMVVVMQRRVMQAHRVGIMVGGIGCAGERGQAEVVA